MDTFELVIAGAVTAALAAFALVQLGRGVSRRIRRRPFERWAAEHAHQLDDDQLARFEEIMTDQWRRLGVGMLVGLSLAVPVYGFFAGDPRAFGLLVQLCIGGVLLGEAVDAFAPEAPVRGAGVRVASATRAAVRDVVHPLAVLLMVFGLVVQVVAVLLAFAVIRVGVGALGAIDWLAPTVSMSLAVGAAVVSIAAIVTLLRRPSGAATAPELECLLALRRLRIQGLIATLFSLSFAIYTLPLSVGFLVTNEVPSAAFQRVSFLQWAVGLPGGLLTLAGLCLSSWRGPGPWISTAPDFPEEKTDRSGPETPARSSHAVG